MLFQPQLIVVLSRSAKREVKRGIKSVYISTNMNKFGGLGAYDPAGHEEYFAAISGVIRYKPNATGQLGDISRSSTTSFPGSSLFWRKDPGQGWSRDPADSAW